MKTGGKSNFTLTGGKVKKALSQSFNQVCGLNRLASYSTPYLTSKFCHQYLSFHFQIFVKFTLFRLNDSEFYSSMKQLLYETCLCVWLLSYYEPAIEYLATSTALSRLIDVVKGSTKEKVSRGLFISILSYSPLPYSVVVVVDSYLQLS